MTAIALDRRHAVGFGGSVVLADISLAIAEGEFVGVLGANGAGKTTLMRAILGLHAAGAGGDPRVRQAGRRAATRPIGYLPQIAPRCRRRPPDRPGLPRRRDRRPSLGPAARFGAQRPREIDRVLRRSSTPTHSRAARLADMSGGERQRLLLAQALLGKPRLLLLDEPLISLDPHQQHVVVDLVRDLSRELN